MSEAMALDPRTPVLVGVGQWSNRVDRGDPAVEPVDMMAEALRRAADDSGAPGRTCWPGPTPCGWCRCSRRYRNRPALVAERIGAAPRQGVSPDGRQRAPGAGGPGLPRHRRRRRRPRADLRRRGVADPIAPRPARARLDRRRTHRPPRPAARPRGSAEPPGRDGPRACSCRPGVPPVRAGAATAPPGVDRRAPGARQRAVGRLQRGGRGQPARLDPGAADRRGDPHPPAGQPLDRLAVHEGHELQQRGRAGGGADPVLGRAGHGAGRAPRPLGVPAGRHRGARPYAVSHRGDLHSSPAPSAWPAGGCSSWPGSASTTSPTSTSTRASRRRCRSAPPSSAWALDRRSPSPAACRSPAGRGTTT